MVDALPTGLSASLAPAEKMLWCGRPRPYVFMLRGLPNIAYGVTWAVLGAVWFRGSGGIGRYSAFEGWWRLTPLFSFPFILAGLSFFLYPIRLGARARRTWYVITDQRVFTAELSRNHPPVLRIFREPELAAMQIVERSPGLSDLLFSRSARENPHLKPRLESGFFGIENGPQAADLIRSNPSLVT